MQGLCSRISREKTHHFAGVSAAGFHVRKNNNNNNNNKKQCGGSPQPDFTCKKLVQGLCSRILREKNIVQGLCSRISLVKNNNNNNIVQGLCSWISREKTIIIARVWCRFQNRCVKFCNKMDSIATYRIRVHAAANRTQSELCQSLCIR